MLRFLPTLLAIAVAATLPASPAGAQEPASLAELLSLPGAEADDRIAYGPGPLQFGDLYLPSGAGPHPVLAFLHGGCFLSNFDIAHTASLSRAVADQGYAVWSLEYRRVGNEGGGWPRTFQDVGRGLDHLRAVATEHALDLDRVVVGGHSAGGTLSLWAAGRERIPEESELWVEQPLEVHAVFGLAAVGDLEAVQKLGACGNVVDRLLGGAPTAYPERYGAASPMQLVPLDVPVTFVVGALDRTWTPPSISWVYRARAVGTTGIEVVELPESGHFEMIMPTSSSWPRVIAALKATFDEIGR